MPPFKDIMDAAKKKYMLTTGKSEEQIEMQTGHAEEGKTKEKLPIGGSH